MTAWIIFTAGILMIGSPFAVLWVFAEPQSLGVRILAVVCCCGWFVPVVMNAAGAK